MERRPGEKTLALPAQFDAGLYFIGRIRTPWPNRDACPKNGAESDAVCRIELDKPYAEGLQGIATCSHLWILYFMDRAARDIIVQRPRLYNSPRGTFALRSPARPNPIALSAVRLIGIERTTLIVQGLDCIDGTPLIDIKPYFASIDSNPTAAVGWHAASQRPAQGISDIEEPN
jgi:tRNA-Thr(GGU) m(6)t(6)A37 methyltransferase TsaA